ncbi:MAG: GNAT family N-acetyltransferase [Chloroflexi bacterium]|nr:GNAT family N-acetyltransferase [Chloroflexota bacterium]
MDKTLPYYRVILKRQPGAPLPEMRLPAGYRIVHFQAGDEQAWAEIEHSVDEFESVANALIYFRRDYLPYLKELERRTLFIETEAGLKVGTFTAWWNYTGVRRHPFMHWVAVRPEYQHRGLGKALVAEGVRLMVAIEGDCAMYIPTQTWSYKAIRIYRWAGFELETEEPAPGGMENHTQEGIPIIAHLIGL